MAEGSVIYPPPCQAFCTHATSTSEPAFHVVPDGRGFSTCRTAKHKGQKTHRSASMVRGLRGSRHTASHASPPPTPHCPPLS